MANLHRSLLSVNPRHSRSKTQFFKLQPFWIGQRRLTDKSTCLKNTCTLWLEDKEAAWAVGHMEHLLQGTWYRPECTVRVTCTGHALIVSTRHFSTTIKGNIMVWKCITISVPVQSSLLKRGGGAVGFLRGGTCTEQLVDGTGTAAQTSPHRFTASSTWRTEEIWREQDPE